MSQARSEISSPGNGVVVLPPPAVTTPTTRVAPPEPDDADAVRRRELLEKIVDDRSDLKRLAGSVQSIAHTVDTAQRTLVLTRRSLRWLLLAGSAVSLGLWLSNARRSKATLLAGVSMHLLGRWLEPTERNAPLAPIRKPLASPAARPRAT